MLQTPLTTKWKPPLDEIYTGCALCKKQLPVHMFTGNVLAESGYNSACKECCRAMLDVEAPEGKKLCSSCWKVLEKHAFNPNSRAKDKLNKKCNKCCKESESRKFDWKAPSTHPSDTTTTHTTTTPAHVPSPLSRRTGANTVLPAAFNTSHTQIEACKKHNRLNCQREECQV